MVATETQWAYAAGLVDGEGHIQIRMSSNQRGRRYHRLVVRVSNTDPGMLCWLYETFGGYITLSHKETDAHRELNNWDLSGREAADFLAGCRPYLITKRHQAEIAAKFNETVGPRGTRQLPDGALEVREQARLELRALTRRGPQ